MYRGMNVTRRNLASPMAMPKLRDRGGPRKMGPAAAWRALLSSPSRREVEHLKIPKSGHSFNHFQIDLAFQKLLPDNALGRGPVPQLTAWAGLAEFDAKLPSENRLNATPDGSIYAFIANFPPKRNGNRGVDDFVRRQKIALIITKNAKAPPI